MDDLEKKAIDVQGKFELYLISLTFTLLALSIQTASFRNCIISDIFELTGWVLLLSSGITGIMRYSHIPVVLRFQAAINIRKDVDKECYEKYLAKVASHKPLWLFIAGVAFVMLSRTVTPLIHIAESVKNVI